MKNPLVSKRMFRYEDNVRLAGNAGPQRQVSRMTSHHFDNLHPAMRAGGRAGSFDYFGYVAKGGVKSESIIGAGDVLVDCLRNADRPHAILSESRGHTERILSSADHDCIKSELFNILDCFPGTILKAVLFHGLPERIGSRRTEIRSAIAVPPPHGFAV